MRTKARIKCNTYGGKLGWFLRLHFSKYTSSAYLETQYMLRKSLFKKYIAKFNEEKNDGNVILPCLVSIETINRCNSTCSFCPANKNSETRPFAKMSDEIFEKIIAELEELQYDGYLNLYVNNEPFIDTKIEEKYEYAKKHLPKAKMLLYTNGTLITLDRFKRIIPFIDKMIINNYTETYRLHDNIEELYNFVKENSEYWDKDISIQIRYIKEILTNRAGSAPNKKTKKKMGKICIMPFTDFTIYPDGTVGLCCSDALEKTNYGNLNDSTLYEIWTSEIYDSLRKSIGKDRSTYPFCKYCDFVDAGIRNTFMKNKLTSH